MPPRISNAVLASKIDDLAEDIAELKSELRTINGAQRGLDLRVTTLETKQPTTRDGESWSLGNPKILLLALTAIVLLVEVLGRVI